MAQWLLPRPGQQAENVHRQGEEDRFHRATTLSLSSSISFTNIKGLSQNMNINITFTTQRQHIVRWPHTGTTDDVPRVTKTAI